MPLPITQYRMSALAVYDGQIGIEGEKFDTEVVIRIPMDDEKAHDLYNRLLTGAM